jgi:hypothetical protein
MRTRSLSAARALAITTIVLGMVATTSACISISGNPHTIKFEVTGPGVVDKVSYAFPLESQPTTKSAVDLPWTLEQTSGGAGDTSVTVTPKSPGVSCRILVDGKVVDTQQGQPNVELKCTAKIKD